MAEFYPKSDAIEAITCNHHVYSNRTSPQWYGRAASRRHILYNVIILNAYDIPSFARSRTIVDFDGGCWALRLAQTPFGSANCGPFYNIRHTMILVLLFFVRSRTYIQFHINAMSYPMRYPSRIDANPTTRARSKNICDARGTH